MSRYLGIDYGEKRIGLAISDPTRTIAQPFNTLKNLSEKFLMRELAEIVQTYHVQKVVLGLPLTMKGTDSKMTRSVREFCAKLEKQLDIPIYLFDERLSSVQAHITISQLGKKPSKNKEKVDQFAAQAILQAFLDKEKHQGEDSGTI